MSGTSTQPKPTAGRRGQGRNGGRTASQKAYASENDVAVVDASPYNPHTPEKMGFARVNNAKQRKSNNNHNHNHNRRSATKQKNAASTSPEPDQLGQRTTPQRPASVKGPNGVAFAGATFHASPAPSALPMPSFFSKPAGGSPDPQEPQRIVQQPSPPATDTDIPTPQHGSVAEKSNASPLDFMFRAHRQEKQRQNQGQSPAVDHNTTSPNKSPFAGGSLPKASSMPHTRPVPTRHVCGGAMDDEELGGNYNQPMGPAFSTPFHDRIKAARSTHGRPVPGQESSPEDPTEALKRYLFGRDNQPPSSRPALSESPSATRTHGASLNAHNGDNIKAMENDLRRILKLDAGPVNADYRVFTQ